MASQLQESTGRRERAVARIAAIGDLHFGADSAAALRGGFERVAELADALLLAGDLTQHGTLAEGRLLAGELSGLGVPVACVFGNHDFHHDAQAEIRSALEDVGIVVLESQSICFTVGDVRVGIAGTKGFGGGFAGACGSDFGEPEMKAFVRHTKAMAARLRDALCALDCDVRIALTHYAPIKETLMGERLEIYPFLGSYLLGEAIDAAACDLAIHGHAHRGVERGVTAAGVPVRNVARPVIKHAFKVYHVAGREPPRVS